MLILTSTLMTCSKLGFTMFSGKCDISGTDSLSDGRGATLERKFGWCYQPALLSKSEPHTRQTTTKGFKTHEHSSQ